MPQRKGLIAVTAVLLTFAATACRHTAPAAGPDASRTTSEAAAGALQPRIVSAKGKIMSADYRADLESLARVRDEIAPFSGDGTVGYLVRYWTGFASWRIALNGASHEMKAEDLKANLLRAAADFDASVALRPDFADGYAAAASVNGWLASFFRDDPDAFRDYVARSGRNLARAKELDPDNPRVLWVAGGDLLFKPPQWGGSTERAVEIYVRASEIAGSPEPGSPLPDWGKPEAIMALAYAHMIQAKPDLAAAEKEAQSALRIEPRWSYVRDVLLPQIRAAAAKTGQPPSAAPTKTPGERRIGSRDRATRDSRGS